MKREIKFRAWDLEDGMVYFDFDTFQKDYHDQYGNTMQYTGLIDKNGKEIYEGDIIARRGMKNGYVGYGKGKWSLRNDEVNVEWRTDLHNQLSMHIEIIGNIYENPELLKA